MMMTFSEIKPFDYRWIRHGKQISLPTLSDLKLLEPFTLEQPTSNSKALLLLHGFASSPAVFRHFYPELKNYQYISAPCLPGHGTSIQNFSKSGFNNWLSFAQQELGELTKRFDKVDVLGLSLGGLIACQLAQTFEINHLYLLAPALALKGPIPLLLNTAKVAQYFGFSAIYNRGGQVYNTQEAELSYRQLPLHPIIEILQSIQNYQHQSWTHPTSLFLGKHDKVVDSRQVDEILKSLPNVKTYVLENSAHVLPIESDYQSILKVIKDRA